MKKNIPLFLIILIYSFFIFYWHQSSLQYRFSPTLIKDYLRSQDIEDKEDKIKDRIHISDSDIYLASGYLYAKGESPVKYNFQHPPLIKYLFGFSTRLTGNPFYVQIFFGLSLIFLTYYLGIKLFKNKWISFLGAMFLLIDPVFGDMINEALLDLGQSVFALGYLILIFFFPESYILPGIVLGAFASSKFWSTAVILFLLAFGYKIFIQKQELNYSKITGSFLIAFLVFSLTYLIFFVNKEGPANFFLYQARILKFMITHNSAASFGGPITLFLTGFFAPWWQEGVVRSNLWSFLWPIGLITSVLLAFKTKPKDSKFFFFLLPIIYLFLISTQVAFARYFILVLPYLYLGLSKFLITSLKNISSRFN